MVRGKIYCRIAALWVIQLSPTFFFLGTMGVINLIDDSTVLKRGSSSSTSREVEAMRFVSKHIKIPDAKIV